MLMPKLRKIERSLAEKVVSLNLFQKINPNIISVLTLIPAIIFIFLITNKQFILGVIFILISLFLDMIDGAVARKQNKTTNFGIFLDPIMDKIVEFLIYLGLFLSGFELQAFLILGLIFLNSLTRVWALTISKNKIADWPAIGDISERYFLLIIGLIVHNFKDTFFEIPTLSIFLYFILAITFIGFIQRIVFAKRTIQ